MHDKSEKKFEVGCVSVKSHSVEIDPRMRQAFFMRMQGKKIYEIAEHFGVSRKTIGRWLRKLREEDSINVDDENYQKLVCDFLEIYGIARKINLASSIRSFVAGDKAASYNHQRQAAAERKHLDKSLERLGLKFKSSLEIENAKLKTLCAWALIFAGRMRDNNDAILHGEDQPWDNPTDIAMNEINKFRECPEMFQIERYIDGVKELFAERGYMDCVDFETLAIARSFQDPLFDPAANMEQGAA